MKMEKMAGNLNNIVQPLLEWYRDNRRQLPWRDQNNAYYTWVSEIMLQQTRVEAVKPYFKRFIGELPDIQALAACPEEKLMKLWEGLGYYNRVRNMQLAAQTVVSTYGGKLPASYKQLLELKGIGNYTAGAIASIAYVASVPEASLTLIPLIPRFAEFIVSISTVILFVISASAPTCKLNDNVSATVAYPLLIV